MKYSEKLQDPRWQKKRLEVMQRDNFSCVNCGCKTKTLHVHHLNYKGNPWDVSIDVLETLCKDCHFNEHKPKERKFKYEPIIVDTDYVLNFDLEYGKPFMHGDIKWSLSEYIKYSNLNDADYKISVPGSRFSQVDWVKHLELSLQESCKKWNYIVNHNGILYGK